MPRLRSLQVINTQLVGELRVFALWYCLIELLPWLLKPIISAGEATNRKLLVGETASSFKLHARGNPHVDGAVITMTLRKRHELVLSSLFPCHWPESELVIQSSSLEPLAAEEIHQLLLLLSINALPLSSYRTKG